MTTNKPMGHYLFIFGAAYIGITILMSVIGAFISSNMTAMTILAPFFSAIFAGERFLKVEQRLPSTDERHKLTNSSFLIFAVINLVLIGLAALVGAFGDAGESLSGGTLVMIFGGVFAVMLLIVYFMIRWAYCGRALDKRAEKLIKQDTTFD